MSDSMAVEINQILHCAEQLYTKGQVEATLDRMAESIGDAVRDSDPIMLCVMIGGMTPTAKLISRFDFTHQLDYIHVSRYRGETTGDELEWYAVPRLSLRDRVVVVIDDILDEGVTLKHVLEYCERNGAARVLSAVLVRKCHDRLLPGIRVDFVGLDVPDRYVFGCGMDYKEHLRHLSGIFALPQNEKESPP